MQLLIQRDQSPTVKNRSRFLLWAKYELTGEEQALVQKYDIYNTILAEGKPNALRKAAIWGIFITFIPATLYIMAMAGAADLLTAVTVIIFLIYPLSVYVIYQQTRTLIKVSDLLQGRTFPCKSVVGLLVKEKEVVEMTLAFRHLLEALKNWRAREIVKLEPYVASTMPMIESSHENT